MLYLFTIIIRRIYNNCALFAERISHQNDTKALLRSGEQNAMKAVTKWPTEPRIRWTTPYVVFASSIKVRFSLMPCSIQGSFLINGFPCPETTLSGMVLYYAHI